MSSAQADALSGDPVVVIGAGPAGLTAAYELVKAGDPVVVAEADDVVGGISRTVQRDGWRFDIGGHRFFTKVRPVEALWHEILPEEDFLLRPRKSRIYYEGKYYDYPLRPVNALRNLGPVEAVLLRPVLPVGPAAAAQGPDQLRGVAGGPLRLAPLPHLLQDLHREGVGDPGLRDAGRLRRPAGEEPGPRQGHHQRAHAQAEPDGDHHPDRGVPATPSTGPG